MFFYRILPHPFPDPWFPAPPSWALSFPGRCSQPSQQSLSPCSPSSPCWARTDGKPLIEGYYRQHKSLIFLEESNQKMCLISHFCSLLRVRAQLRAFCADFPVIPGSFLFFFFSLSLTSNPAACTCPFHMPLFFGVNLFISRLENMISTTVLLHNGAEWIKPTDLRARQREFLGGGSFSVG